MSPDLFYILLKILGTVVMLFQLRSLMESSSVDYYHPLTQTVTKLTNPLVNISLWRSARVFGFAAGGFVVSFLIAFVGFFVISILLLNTSVLFALVGSIFMFIKSFGTLIVILMLVQALCSWLPATQHISYTLAQCTSFITRPVQRIIPPIGMIDISLMIVLLAIFALDTVLFKLWVAINPFLGFLWSIV